MQGISLVFFALFPLRSALNVDEKRIIVEKHNWYRSQRDPLASDMKKLSWDSTLETLAKSYAAKCIWDHNIERGFRGENLFVMTGPSFDVELGLIDWYQELDDYDFTNNTCTEGKMCGHYTQMVWASTERIGCGYHLCETMEGYEETNVHFLVCNYEPPGNFQGRKPYRVGVPCSECQSDDICGDSLCEKTIIQGEDPTALPDMSTEHSVKPAEVNTQHADAMEDVATPITQQRLEETSSDISTKLLEDVSSVVTPKPLENGNPLVTPNALEYVSSIVTPKSLEVGSPVATTKPLEDGSQVITPKSLKDDSPFVTPKPPEDGSPVLTPKPLEDGSPVVTPKPLEDGSPAVTSKPLEYGSPVVTSKPLEDGSPAVTSKPLEYGNPVVTSKPLKDSNPVVTSKPLEYGSPVVTSKPLENGSPVVTSKPLEDSSPVVTPKPLEDSSQIVTPKPLVDGSPVVTPKPLEDGSPVVTFKPLEVGSQVITPKPLENGSPVITLKPMKASSPVVTPKPSHYSQPTLTPKQVDSKTRHQDSRKDNISPNKRPSTPRQKPTPKVHKDNELNDQTVNSEKSKKKKQLILAASGKSLKMDYQSDTSEKVFRRKHVFKTVMSQALKVYCPQPCTRPFSVVAPLYRTTHRSHTTSQSQKWWPLFNSLMKPQTKPCKTSRYKSKVYSLYRSEKTGY